MRRDGKEKDRLSISLCFYSRLSSCHSRNISDIKSAMTKRKSDFLVGANKPITHKDADGFTLEIWDYHFASSDSICSDHFCPR